jgi:hypothetical protein
MNPETEEKKKNTPLNRKFLLRGLVICVFLLLLPFAGIQAWKQSVFLSNKSLWEQNYQGDYLIYYGEVGSGAHFQMRDDELWQIAQDCLTNFGCEITYSQSAYLPLIIDFNNSSQHSLEVGIFYNCNNLPYTPDEFYYDEIRKDCQAVGFELITNNE